MRETYSMWKFFVFYDFVLSSGFVGDDVVASFLALF
jgi:hypothetical protein